MAMTASGASAAARESRLPAYLSLFASFSTLLCCALPSVFVLFGLGATVASVLSTLPWLVALSRHRAWVFGISGLLIALDAVYVYRFVPTLARPDARCPPGDESACATASRFSRRVLLASAILYCIGFLVAFALGPLLIAMDQ